MYTKELTEEFGRILNKFLEDMKSGWLDDTTVADAKKAMLRFNEETADLNPSSKEG